MNFKGIGVNGVGVEIIVGVVVLLCVLCAIAAALHYYAQKEHQESNED